MIGFKKRAVRKIHRIKTAVSQIQPPLVGMEISQTSIKMVRIEREKGGWRLLARTKLPIDESVLKLQYKHPNVVDSNAFQVAVLEAIDAVGGNISRISLSLPNQVLKASIQTYEALPSGAKEVERMVRWGFSNAVRGKADDIQVSHQLIGENSAGEKRLLVAVGFQEVIKQYENLLKELNLQAVIIRPAGINQLNFYGREYDSREISAYLGFFHHYFIFAVIDRRRLVFYHGIRADVASSRFMFHLDMMIQFYKDIYPDLVIDRLYLGHPGKKYYPQLSEGLKALITPHIECLEERELMTEESAMSDKFHDHPLKPKSRPHFYHAYSSAIGAAQALSN